MTKTSPLLIATLGRELAILTTFVLSHELRHSVSNSFKNDRGKPETYAIRHGKVVRFTIQQIVSRSCKSTSMGRMELLC